MRKKCSAEQEGYEIEMHKMRQVFMDISAAVSPIKAVEGFSHAFKNIMSWEYIIFFLGSVYVWLSYLLLAAEL